MVTHQMEVHYNFGILDSNLTYTCQEWSPTIPRTVTRQPKDGHPPEERILQIWNLALKFNSQN